MFNIIRVDQYTLLKLEDSGQYGFKLMEGWEGKDGDFKLNFCKREFKKGGGEKTTPVSVKLGDKQTAIAVLQALLKELSGEVENNEPATTDNIPF